MIYVQQRASAMLALAMFFWGSGLSATAADLLEDSSALKQKVREIVGPYLHEAPENEKDDAGETRSDDGQPQAKGAGNRAWGIVVGVTSKRGRQVFGYGRVAADVNEQPDGKTLFEIGSVTKTFTALLLADLAERGKVKLDDPVRLYLPESVSLPKRGDKEITLAHLATHTSALPRIPTSIGLISLVSKNPYVDYDAEDLYKTLSRVELDRDPGERYAYSNLAFGLLGHVLSRHGNCSYEELVVERICRPLGLNDTRIELNDDQRKRFAKPYAAGGASSSTWEFDALAGAGALRSTANDMLAYLEANMGLKKSELLPAMRHCHKVRHPAESKTQSIGLGWHEQMATDARLLFHGGGTGGYSSLVGFVEQQGQPTIGVVVLSNAAPAAIGGMVANDVAVNLLNVLQEESR